MGASVNVEIFDTTLRDGAQSLPEVNQFEVGSKSEIANKIAMFGVSVIEAGFPRTEGDGEEVRAVADTVGNTTYMVQRWGQGEYPIIIAKTPVIAGLSRTTEEDIDATWDSVQGAMYPRIHTFISTDPEHMKAKFPGKTASQVLAMGRRSVAYAKNISAEHPGASVEFSAEAASTTNPKFLERVVKTALDQGADVINLPDTVGQKTPREMGRFYDMALGWIQNINPDAVLSSHNHDDGGMADANSYELVESARTIAFENNTKVRVQLEGTVTGIGERAGQMDIFPTAATLHRTRNSGLVPVTFEVNPILAVATARDVLAFGGMKVERQSPIVGSDVKVHRSGIHSDGVIKGGHTIYTPFNPTDWGHATDAVHEHGRYQGRAGANAAGPN